MTGYEADYTWKDIPWAKAEAAPIPLPAGIQAVIPRLDERGRPTNEFMVLPNAEYIQAMGELAYQQATLSGNPDEIIAKMNATATTAFLAAQYPAPKPLTLEGMKK